MSIYRAIFATTLLALTSLQAFAIDPGQKPIRALLVTGGCCHDYSRQREILTQGISARARVVWTVVQQGGSTTNTKIPLYENEDWWKDFDIIVHNECFAGVTDPKWTERILKPHREGLPGIVIHCAMHSYRDKTDEWFKFCGVTSHRHGAHYAYTVDNINKQHPIMKSFGDKWTTPKGELYLISKMWETATPLASAKATNGKSEVCMWTNTYGKGKVFGTTIGHHNETMMEPAYLNTLTRGLLWAVGKLDEDHFTRVDTPPAIDLSKPVKTASQPKRAVKKGMVPENLAFGKKAAADRSQAGHPPQHAFDGSDDTRWCAPNNDAGYYLQVDLGKPEELTGCNIFWEQSNRRYRYALEGSKDGEQWAMLSDQTETESLKQLHELKFSAKDIQFVRVKSTEVPSGSWMSIWEMEVLGTRMVKATAKKREPKQRGILSKVQVPEGFQATVFAAPPEINYPTCIAAGPQGTVFVGVDQNGSLGKDKTKVQRIVRCIDDDGDGTADRFNTFADQVGSVRGMHYDNGTMWVLHPPLLRAFYDDDLDGTADRNEVLVEGLGTPALAKRGADHCTNGFRMGIDGWLYIAVGDFGFTKAVDKEGTELQLYGGGILRVRPDGTEMELFARGTRNIYDVAVGPRLNVFTRDNTNDGGGWNVRLSHIIPTGHYGYPSYFKNFPKYMVQPLADYGGGSPTGSLYLEDAGLPTPYSDALYTCDWGRNVVYRHPLKQNGAGFVAEQQEFVKVVRPTDMDVDDQSRLFITSWDGGSFSYKSPNVGYVIRVVSKTPAQAEIPSLKSTSLAKLLEVLATPKQFWRMAAQRELIRRGPSDETLAGLVKLAESKEPLATRVAALFTLKQVGGEKANPLLAKLAADPAITEHCLHALADRKSQLTDVPAELFVQHLQNDNPRVQLQAARGVARLGRTDLAANIVPLTASNDPLVAHVAVNALVTLSAVRACLDAVTSEPTPIANGALLALSQIHRQDVVRGLTQLALSNPEKETQPAVLTTLCRLYFKEGEWTGGWWGTRPDTSGPYYQPIHWEGSGSIEGVVRHVAAQADGSLANHLRQELTRHKINLKDLKFGSGAAMIDPKLLVNLPSLNAAEQKQVAALAMNKTEDRTLRVQAFQALRRSGFELTGLVSVLAALARDADADASMLARQAFIYDPQHATDIDKFLKLTQSDDEHVRRLAFSILIAIRSGAFATEEVKSRCQQAIATALEQPHTASSLALAAGDTGDVTLYERIEKLKTSTDSALKTAAETAIKQLQPWRDDTAKPIGELSFEQAERETLNASAEVTIGAQLFIRQQCISCHTVSSSQTPIGPYLGGIAKRYQPHELLESIIKPNAKVAQGFATQVFVTDSGKTITGFVVKEGANSVEVRDARGQKVLVPKDEIDERITQKTSMMPKGLVDNLTPKQLAALLAYLQSLEN